VSYVILRLRSRAHGALLLEVMLALTIFVVGGLAVLAIVDRAIGALHAARDAEHGSMLARSAMARIEAGVALPQALNGPVRASGEDGSGDDGAPEPDGAWELEINTEPSAVRGLTLVRITAIRRGAGSDGKVRSSQTLSQLVRLARAVSMVEGARP